MSKEKNSYQESLEKTKEGGKETCQGLKKIISGTSWSLFYVLKWLMDMIDERDEEDKKNTRSSWRKFKKAWKETRKWVRKTIKWLWKWVKWWMDYIDAKYQERKENKTGKTEKTSE